MEPVTHFLTGACIGRAGLNRKTALATVAAVLAAEAADLDVVWGLGGPVDELKHHCGITHTFIAAPVVAGVVTLVVWGYHVWRERRRARKLATLTLEPGAPLPPSLAPRKLHLGWLYLATLIAALSHILLDWTNNYGVRPFFPFNPQWYAGSVVFIAEPVLWALFLAALVAAARESLVNAAKHSRTTSSSLYAEVEPDAVHVFVKDRGVGFDPDEVADDRHGVRGSIVARIERHGGTVDIVSKPNEGTEVRMKVPTTR